MSPWALWLYVILLIGSGTAADVPFVFDESALDVAGFTSDEIEHMSSSSDDLNGVPTLSSPQDEDVLQFPNTGGGGTPGDKVNLHVGEIRGKLNSKVELKNDTVHFEAVKLAGNNPGDYTIAQVSSIYSSLKDGWSYVRDTRGIDNFNSATESISLGKFKKCVGAGDCDDFAILMAAFIESIGGTTRVIFARNNITGGHAYTEVYLGQLDSEINPIDDIINWLKDQYETDKIFAHIENETKEVWLNLDWGKDDEGYAHPGGPLYPGDIHIIVRINSNATKTTVSVPQKINKPPKLIALAPDKSSPQEVGTAVTWTTKAVDPDNDQMLYRFFLNNEPVTKWLKDNKWTWKTTDYDIGDNTIEVQVRDGEHAGPEKYDSIKAASYTINIIERIPIAAEKIEISHSQPQETTANLNNAYVWNDKGNALYKQGRYDEAAKAYDKFIELAPNSELAWRNKGLALNKLGKYDEAVQALDKAIQLDPNSEVAWRNKGLDLYELGKYNEAIQASDEAIGINPKNKDAWNDKGNALYKQGRYDEAAKAYDKFIELAPNSELAWRNKGLALNKLGKYDEAVQAYDKAIGINPQYGDAWRNKGGTLYRQGKYDEAVQAYDKALEINPQDAYASSEKSTALMEVRTKDNE